MPDVPVTPTIDKPAVDATAAAPKPLRVPIADKVAAAVKAHAEKAAKLEVKASEGEAPKPADDKTVVPGEVPKPADDKPAEPKPEDKKLSRGFAELAEREAKHVEATRAFKDATAKFETERKANEAEVTWARQLREAVKKDPVAAFKLTGIDLDAFLETYVANLQPQDPREVARKEFERLEGEKQAKAEQERKAAETAQQQQFEEGRGRWVGQIEALAKEMGDKFGDEFDLCVAHEVTGDQVFARAWAEGLKSGKLPSPKEALALVEADLAARVARSKKFVAKAAKAEDKQEAKAGDKAPKTLEADGAGEVPLQRKPNGKAVPVKERIKEVLRQRGLS